MRECKRNIEWSDFILFKSYEATPLPPEGYYVHNIFYTFVLTARHLETFEGLKGLQDALNQEWDQPSKKGPNVPQFLGMNMPLENLQIKKINYYFIKFLFSVLRAIFFLVF